MAQINFPAASESPWYNPDNGVTYEYVGGTWRTVTDNGSSLDDIYVKEIGDTMTGELILYGNPAQNLGATPKQYVDTEITNAISGSEGSETGRLDGRYLRKDSAAGAQTVASTGTTTFNGLVEAGDGVKVTGGNAADIGNGMYARSGDIFIAVNDQERVTITENSCQFNGLNGDVNHFTSNPQYSAIRAKNTTLNNSTLTLTTEVDKADISTHNIATAGAPKYTNVANNATLRGFMVNDPQNNSSATGVAFYGFTAVNMTDKFDTNVGYRSQVGTGNGSTANFNFFADGAAPNFLKGNTYIGGTETRNTLELWKSTLTEEQLEELAAGTLAIPANVSTPGDGSFVRQWWYDQQSVEDQALIDSGELDYPDRYQAANFVDTFALGDNTKFNFDTISGLTIKVGSAATPGLKWFASTGGIHCDGSSNFTIKNKQVQFRNLSDERNVTISDDNIAIGDAGVDTRVKLLVSGNVAIRGNGGTTASDGYGMLLNADFNEIVNAGSGNTNLNLYTSAPKISYAGTVDRVRHFTVAPGAFVNRPTEEYGFYSTLNTSDAYNFFAAGNAPNYFKGNIDCDGLINELTVGMGGGSVETNTAIGRNVLLNNTTGNQNTAIGRNALYNNTEGTNNTALGLGALVSNITGSNNTALGQNALYNNTGNLNTAVGQNALFHPLEVTGFVHQVCD